MIIIRCLAALLLLFILALVCGLVSDIFSSIRQWAFNVIAETN